RRAAQGAWFQCRRRGCYPLSASNSTNPGKSRCDAALQASSKRGQISIRNLEIWGDAKQHGAEITLSHGFYRAMTV
ncbi:hypothetical protein ABTK66_18585, partial [Acinetobacter baumannii]